MNTANIVPYSELKIYEENIWNLLEFIIVKLSIGITQITKDKINKYVLENGNDIQRII